MNEWLGFRAEGLEYFLWFMHALSVAGKGFFGHISRYFNYCEKNKIWKTRSPEAWGILALQFWYL